MQLVTHRGSGAKTLADGKSGMNTHQYSLLGEKGREGWGCVCTKGSWEEYACGWTSAVVVVGVVMPPLLLLPVVGSKQRWRRRRVFGPSAFDEKRGWSWNTPRSAAADDGTQEGRDEDSWECRPQCAAG